MNMEESNIKILEELLVMVLFTVAMIFIIGYSVAFLIAQVIW